MIGSYGPHPRGEPHVKTFEAEESPSGIIARKVTYTVQSRIVDDDNEVYAGGSMRFRYELDWRKETDWNWTFKLAKEWEWKSSLIPMGPVSFSFLGIMYLEQ